MIDTKYGQFDGNSWEEMCQLVFKMRYGEDNYQEVPANPSGDYGIEGFIKSSEGIAIQCYCPDKLYSSKELYEHQRDKITRDINKLKKNEDPLKRILGEETLIKKWIFLTPMFDSKMLVTHATDKGKEVKDWNLGIIHSEFQILIHDADFYAKEIFDIKNAHSEQISFIEPQNIQEIDKDNNSYIKNIKRKNKHRIIEPFSERKFEQLNELTINKLSTGLLYLENINKNHPAIYIQISKIINQYESELEELSLTWDDTPRNLISEVKSELQRRIKSSIPSLAEEDCNKISDHMISTWIALCPLDIG